ncbi:LIC10707 family hydrolase [Leptospira kmetyi]|uniref:SGNH/GDSL hydrolase family protein n=1 Tax=Leptospira kmetyi TaxID=408139 RepID=A0A5F1XMS1_9LEPT|nr:SGNH/GDSL hydrolase family protein [Leptospira kmetyi]AYV57999.1 SGNH/GDSL hydrolase family protein [Leptospira kmetyi]TGK14873.1 SGNH/GDSL hydrolase family protein [Leptospira kmetyi]TGK33514.1 SGNH/GDSL hydrolase family protein [Leptospira kmetyi]
MKKLGIKYSFILILFGLLNKPLLADKNSFTFLLPDQSHTFDHFLVQTNCNTQFDDLNPESFEPDKTFLTMYGDSLGDFVNEGLYGYFGWDKYLTLMNFGIAWNVQNLAIGGYTTENVYNFIRDCAYSYERRINFKTAPNVAFEIGGNDFWHNSIMLTFMPWKFSAVVGRVAFNTKSILYQLRNPRRDKNVLVMGNFPNLSYSPTLGNINNYFVPLATHPDGLFSYNMDKLHEEQQKAMLQDAEAAAVALLPYGWLGLLFMPIDMNELHGEFVQAIIGIKQAYNNALATIQIQTGIEELEILHIQIKNTGISPTNQDEWYWLWLHTIKNNISMVTSLGMLFSQGLLEQTAEEVNAKYGKVHFLPMYHLFIRQNDCFHFGQCWVANPWLYQDQVGHLNYIGYTVWAGALASKVTQLDWHNSLKNGPPHYNGAVSIPGDDTVVTSLPEEQAPQPVQVDPLPIDILLLICLFTGKCW